MTTEFIRLNTRQRGFTVIEMIIVVAIGSFIIGAIAKLWAEDTSRRIAIAGGAKIAQFNSAVSAAIVDRLNAGNPPPVGNFAGVNWLKDAACGGQQPRPYLPCAFTPDMPFGLVWNTTIVLDPVTNNYVGTTTLGIPNRLAGWNPDGQILTAARSYLGAAMRPVGPAMGIMTYMRDPAGNIVAVVNTGPNNVNTRDPRYLWVAGDNNMQGDLNVGGNDIVNTRDVNVSRDVNVVGDTNVGGGINAGDNISTQGGVVAEGNVWAKRDVIASNNVRILNTEIDLAGALQAGNAAGHVQSGSIVPKPSCPVGFDPHLYLSQAQVVAPDGQAYAIGALDILGTDQGAGWKVEIYLMTAKNGGTYEAADPRASILAMTTCE